MSLPISLRRPSHVTSSRSWRSGTATDHARTTKTGATYQVPPIAAKTPFGSSSQVGPAVAVGLVTSGQLIQDDGHSNETSVPSGTTHPGGGGGGGQFSQEFGHNPETRVPSGAPISCMSGQTRTKNVKLHCQRKDLRTPDDRKIKESTKSCKRTEVTSHWHDISAHHTVRPKHAIGVICALRTRIARKRADQRHQFTRTIAEGEVGSWLMLRPPDAVHSPPSRCAW